MSDIKKFLDLAGLTVYDGKIKKVISDETIAGKNADKALKTFLGDPTGYPDNNIPLYADTVNAANTAASDAAEAKSAATEAQNSAAASASAAAASAQDAADILGTPEDDSTKNTVYGVYAKVDDKVNTGLIEISDAVEDGKLTLDDKVGELQGSIDDYVDTNVKPDIDTYVNNTAKTAIDTYVNNTSKHAIDDYVTNTAVPAIDTAKTAAVKDVNDAKTAAVKDVNDAKTAALGEIAVAVKPVTDAKNDAENAAAAAATSATIASNAANTATNAVTGFRSELGDRPDGNPTVWGSIEELKSATAGGVHFAGVISSENVPELNHDSESNTIIGTWTDINHEQQSKVFNIGDIIILVNNPDTYPDEPTKEYILTSHGDKASGYAWAELGDVSPADQKITSLENSKLNKSALEACGDNLRDIDDEYTVVELSADDHAFVRIGAITVAEINSLFA